MRIGSKIDELLERIGRVLKLSFALCRVGVHRDIPDGHQTQAASNKGVDIVCVRRKDLVELLDRGFELMMEAVQPVR
ncbi:MAG TPA: hypothetical protein PKM58_07095 [Pyrinomonadaceae bacterium]|nr:hypothetical protein [Pyrinomonadaceae bacterium]